MQEFLVGTVPDEGSSFPKHKFKCDKCPKTYQTIKKLIRHGRCHRDKIFCCEMCGKKFNFKHILSKHKDRVHSSPNKFDCNYCQKKFSSKDYLERHITSAHTKNFKFCCEKCGKGYMYKNLLKQHIIFTHTDTRFRCPHCEKLFKTQRNFACHVKTHDPNFRKPDYVCGICNKVFHTEEYWKRHENEHNGIFILHTCEICGKKVRHMNIHKRMHAEKTYKFSCEKCGKGFYIEKYLKQHMMSVHSDEVLTCQVCGKIFKNLERFKYHQKSHDPDYKKPTFPCNVCGKVLFMKKNLEIHLRKHTGAKTADSERWKCNLCGKVLTTKQSLTHHVRTHTGEKPFACEHCDKKFAKKEFLKIHMVVHTKERPHVCEICGKSYTQKSPLLKHMKIHKTAAQEHNVT